LKPIHTPKMSWRSNIISDPSVIRNIAKNAKKIAVLGIKTEKQANQPAFFVAKTLQDAGKEIVPVPTLYPDVTEILGKKVVRTVKEAGNDIDVVDVFRKPSDVLTHVDDIISAKPKCVWLQSGITCPEAEEAFAKANILVVADKCLKVEFLESQNAKL